MPPSPAVIHTRRGKSDVWPPKHSSVRELPKTGFSPTVVRESHQGKKFVWPPPKPDFYGNSERPEIHNVGADVQWNPSSPVLVHRPPPFAPQSPVPARRSTDDIWPPRTTQQMINSSQPIPRPVKRVGRFDDYVKHTASVGVPVTYRAPPGTQNVTYVEEEVVEEEEVEEEEVEEEEEED